MYQSSTLHRVFAPRLRHSGQTHRFRRCSSAAAGALEYPKKNSRHGNEEELYFTFYFMSMILPCTSGDNINELVHMEIQGTEDSYIFL